MVLMRGRVVAVLLAVGLALGALAGCGADASTGASSRFEGTELPVPTEKPDFVLTGTDGQPFDFRAETDGSVTLLYFGYTYCPDICPVHLANIAAVLDADPMTAQDVEVVFVSVDPQRDTPEVIRDYLDRFDARFHGVTGDQLALVKAQESAGVAPALIEEPDEDGDYLVGHAGQLLAYAPDGRGYVVYPFGSRQTHLAHDLPILAEMTGEPAS